MPTSIDILLCDDVVAALNAETWPRPFVAERVYEPGWDSAKEMQDLQVAVWPDLPSGDVTFERGDTFKTFPINIGVAVRLVDKNRDEIDLLCDLVMAIVEFIEFKTVETDVGNHRLLNNGWEFRLRFSMEHLQRTKRADGSIGYTGTFISIVNFPFVLLD